ARARATRSGRTPRRPRPSAASTSSSPPAASSGWRRRRSGSACWPSRGGEAMAQGEVTVEVRSHPTGDSLAPTPPGAVLWPFGAVMLGSMFASSLTGLEDDFSLPARGARAGRGQLVGGAGAPGGGRFLLPCSALAAREERTATEDTEIT